MCVWLTAKGVSVVCTNSHSSSRTEVSSRAFSRHTSVPSTSMKTQMRLLAPSRKQRSVHRCAYLMSPKFNRVCLLPYAETSLVFWCQNMLRILGGVYNLMKFLCTVLCLLSLLSSVFLAHSFLASLQNQVRLLLLHLPASSLLQEVTTTFLLFF